MKKRLVARLCVELLEDRTVPSNSCYGSTVSILTHGDASSPNDPRFKDLYGMQKISAEQAWDLSKGKTTTVVADIDTGIDYTHPDLYLNVWINQAEIPAARRAALSDTDADSRITFWDLNNAANKSKMTDVNKNGRIDGGDIIVPTTVGGWADNVDNGSNGFLDDLIGWNFLTNTNDPFDDNGHGTHTAGTIAAIGHNSTGVVGVAWKLQIMALKFMVSPVGAGLNSDAIEAIYYAGANGARVSNNSYGGPGGSNSVSDPFYKAIKDVGDRYKHLFIAAAGNDGINNDSSSSRNYPASYNLPNIISVAATDKNDKVPSWSNYGKTTVDLGAPGAAIWSTYTFVPGVLTGYAAADGTSMSAPHVTGAAALLLSRNATLTHQQIKAAILNNVDKVTSLTNKSVTGGRLNVYRALASVAASSAAPAPASGTSLAPVNGSGLVGVLNVHQVPVNSVASGELLYGRAEAPNSSVAAKNHVPDFAVSPTQAAIADRFFAASVDEDRRIEIPALDDGDLDEPLPLVV